MESFEGLEWLIQFTLFLIRKIIFLKEQLLEQPLEQIKLENQSSTV